MSRGKLVRQSSSNIGSSAPSPSLPSSSSSSSSSAAAASSSPSPPSSSSNANAGGGGGSESRPPPPQYNQVIGRDATVPQSRTATRRRGPSPDLPRLHAAVKEGDVLSATRLLDSNGNADVNSLDHKGRTALHHACLLTSNSHDMVFLLLRRGAYVHAATQRNLLTPLHCACVRGNYDIILLLLKYGADPAAKNSEGKTAFQLFPNNKDTKKFLKNLSKPMDPPKFSKKDKELLNAAAMESELKVLDLLDKAVDVNVHDDRTRMTPLMCAARQGNAEIVRTLLLHCADIHRQDAGKNTALHWACAKGSYDVVSKLIEFDASLNLTEKDNGYTPLHWAAAKNHSPLIGLLIKNHANPNLPDNEGMTVLAVACKSGHAGFVEKLLKFPNVKVNIPDVYGVTPLHRAARSGDLKMASLLLKVNANASAQSLTLSTPLHDACEEPNPKMCLMLLQNGICDVNGKNYQGNTALHIAILSLNRNGGSVLKPVLQTITTLIDGHADTSVRNEEGLTPLMLLHPEKALMNNSPENQVAILLVKAGASPSVLESETYLAPYSSGERNAARDLCQILKTLRM